ncbi:hypothetical protein Egran_02719 [Elaphomyces granulatus]|uniref:Multicopper oxidase n=1 Tax=Elaphomyces granulatus TaxID=519963 RepID=A0A232LZQ4_9EURO|nr:hypothetical protein Egran_02719 [Elaphomyces granulatus]
MLPWFILFLLGLSKATTHTYDFNVTWVTANPDGLYERPVIGINGQWPIPIINTTVGDRVIIHLHNQLGNESTSLHFHGFFQNGTTEMDGPTGVTQCPVPPGSSITYNFTTDQPGTYWYHSHDQGQYPDGLRGPFIVQDPDSPHKGKYTGEFILSVSEWYHKQIPTLLTSFMSYTNPTGVEPEPQAALMNDGPNATFPVQPGQTYFFHIVNMGAFVGQYVWFEGHHMRVIEVDGVWTEEAEADLLYVTAAQRYGVLVTMKNDTSANFPIVSSIDEDMLDKVPPGLNPNVTGYLIYDSTQTLPQAQWLDDFNPFDDFTLVPSDGLGIFDNVDHSMTLDVVMDNLGDGQNYAFLNDTTYLPQKVPTLYTLLSAPEDLVTNTAIYGENTNSLIVEHGEVVEIILNNHDIGKHPFHLHAHNFQVVVRSDAEAGDFDPTNTTALTTAAPAPAFPAVPMRRDTIQVPPHGNVVLRFRADNPGVWLFHCHIQWHMQTGLMATIIEAPLALRAQKGSQGVQALPADHLAACQAGGTLYEGNAGGSTSDWLDLSNANYPPDPLPAGFTARGIVALVFSVVAAFLGMAAISWYGAAEFKTMKVGN